MKKIQYLLFVIYALGLFSCQQVEVPIKQQDPYVNFYDSVNLYRRCIQTQTLNFYYMNDTVTRDTVWFKIVSLGSVPSRDYHVKVIECKTNSNALIDMKNAESGIHYVPFDNPGLQKMMVLHKGALLDQIPVVVLRDKSLKDESRRIVMRIADSDDVKAADQHPDTHGDVAFVALYISDGLAQPTSWGTAFFLGTYGKVKHDFIIRHSGKKWDDSFIKSLDNNSKTYFLYKFKNELAQENRERVAKGLPVLTEKNGTAVEFPQNYY